MGSLGSDEAPLGKCGQRWNLGPEAFFVKLSVRKNTYIRTTMQITSERLPMGRKLARSLTSEASPAGLEAME